MDGFGGLGRYLGKSWASSRDVLGSLWRVLGSLGGILEGSWRRFERARGAETKKLSIIYIELSPPVVKCSQRSVVSAPRAKFFQIFAGEAKIVELINTNTTQHNTNATIINNNFNNLNDKIDKLQQLFTQIIDNNNKYHENERHKIKSTETLNQEADKEGREANKAHNASERQNILNSISQQRQDLLNITINENNKLEQLD